MKRTISFFTAFIISLLLYNQVLAGKVDVPNYRGLPLKAESSCIDSCGEPPDNEDLAASYEYQMCVGDCHPKIDFLHQSIDDLQNQVNDLQAQIDALDVVVVIDELCILYELTEKAPPTLCLNCGDGYLQPLEECDDNNLIDGDGCSAACFFEECGNGRLDYGEVCDDGNIEDGDTCSSDCSTEYRRVFITNGHFSGNLGGLAGADAKCQESAENANLTGIYKAWLSDQTTDARNRLSHFNNGYYVLVDGTPVVNGWDDLITYPYDLINNITKDEYGNLIPSGDPAAWTNTTPVGGRTSNNNYYSCNSWTTTSYYGHYGSSYAPGYGWTYLVYGGTIYRTYCYNELRLYCFEQ